MSKRRKMKFSVELFERIDLYMNSYLENNKNKRYYFKILELFKSFVFIVLESNDTNYMKIPTDSRLLKVLQDFNQQQELESLNNENRHSGKEKEKDKDRVKNNDKERDKRRTRHNRVRDEIREDVKKNEYSNDSVSETSDDTNKLVLDNEEVQSFFQMNA